MNTAQLLGAFATTQRRRGLRQGTIKLRDGQIRRFARHLDSATATTADIEQWLDDRNLGMRTRSSYLNTLNVWYTFLIDHGARADNPVAKIQRPRLRRLLPRPAASDDLRQALRSADPRMRAWLLLAAYEGLRCWEIAGLKREAVLDGNVPPLLMVEDGKGGEQRMLPLNPIVLAALRAFGMPKAGYLFRLNNGKRMPANTLSAYVSRWLAGQGIAASAHNLRHYFGVTCYSRSRDLRTVQQLLGHASPVTTAGYTAWSPSHAAEVVLGLGDDVVT